MLIGISSLIGDNGRYSLNSLYPKAIEAAGGTAVILPYASDIKKQISLLSGVVLSGGEDLDPAIYGQEQHPKTEPPSPQRDEYELALCRAAIEASIPVLGICRGCQVLNVALGGDLVQHVDDHSFNTPRRKDYIHEVTIDPNSRLSQILGGKTNMVVNSIHHQAVGGRLGKNLRAVAKSPEGVIEAVELEGDGFVVGVQWHPEELVDIKDALNLAIFESFIKACKSSKMLLPS